MGIISKCIIVILLMSASFGFGCYYGANDVYWKEYKYYKSCLKTDFYRKNIEEHPIEFLKSRFYFTGYKVCKKHAVGSFQDFGNIDSDFMVPSGKGDYSPQGVYGMYKKHVDK